MRVWRALTSVYHACGGCSRCRGSEAANVTEPQTESVRRQDPTTGPAAGAVRRQSGPPRVRTRLSNQETQILMTTLNAPSAVADIDLDDDDDM